MEYKFYGWETATVKPINNTYQSIYSPRDLYDALSEIWSVDTCAPRMRNRWTVDNKKLWGNALLRLFLCRIFSAEKFMEYCVMAAIIIVIM